MKFILLITTLIFLSGCDLLESQKEKEQKLFLEKAAFEKKVSQTQKIQLEKLSAETKKELALLESKKELAKIEKEKEVEKIRLQTQLQKQKIELEIEKEKAVFEQKMLQIKEDNSMEIIRYIIFVTAILFIIALTFLFYYLKTKREDKLQAYNDNLQKYFHEKENTTRARIAEKLLDTIASGKLDKEQERLLIQSLSNQNIYKEEDANEIIEEIEYKN